MTDLNKINRRLRIMADMVNDLNPVKVDEWQVGIDLGTADIVLTVVDGAGEPKAVFLEWSEVVRDGVVLDYWGAISIVKDLIQKAEKKLNIHIDRAVTSYPPGTDPQISKNVIEAAGIKVSQIIDEPSSVIMLLGISDGAVVDIGGGTTGIALIKNRKIIHSADEPTGGRHVTLTLAGNRKISFEQAEKMKKDHPTPEIMAVVRPVFQKMAEIVRNQVDIRLPGALYLSGGTCCFPGLDQLFAEEITGKEIILPAQPLYLTPLAIASYGIKG